ncbi:hypothetical protein D3C78_1907300 [compost metagenome]
MALVQITVEQVRTADGDHADLVRPCITHVGSGIIQHDGAHILVGDSYPDRADVAFAMWRIDR